eukprot:5266917-Pyramimonas_sp.AAC.1
MDEFLDSLAGLDDLDRHLEDDLKRDLERELQRVAEAPRPQTADKRHRQTHTNTRSEEALAVPPPIRLGSRRVMALPPQMRDASYGAKWSAEDEDDFEEEEKGPKGGTSGSDARQRKGRSLSIEEIRPLFNLTIKEAAARLDVGLTWLKKECRVHNIQRWPKRKLESVASLQENLKLKGAHEELDVEEVNRMCEDIGQQLYADPSTEFDS